MQEAAELFGDDPILMEGYNYWLFCKDAERLPRASQIDPLDIPPRIFPNILLVDYLKDRIGIRYRLIGQETVDRWGGESFAGKYSHDQYSGSYRDFLEGAYEQSRALERPIYTESAFRWDTGGTSHTRRLMLPYADDALEEVTRNLCIQVWPGGVAPDGGAFTGVVVDASPDVDHIGPRQVGPRQVG